MSIEAENLDTPEASSDPTALPLFAAAPTNGVPAVSRSRKGRRRGSFVLGGDAAPDTEPLTVTPTPPAPLGGDPGHRDHGDGLDWAVVAVLRQQTADRLSLETTGSGESTEAQQERGRAIIYELLTQESAERARALTDPWNELEQHRLAKAVFGAVFGLGRLQPLVDDPEVENIMIFGHDRVVLELTGGRQVQAAPVANSDEELLEFLAFVATRSEVNARSFSPSQPRLHLRLDGGARLAAQAWVAPRPQAVIRRHRMRDTSLEDMVALGALSPLAASFLGAVVRSGRSVLVSGAQGAGKTKMVRALCNEIPTYEVIGTFETEYELHLHEMTQRHPYCFAYEARPGSGEVGPDGQRAGEVTLEQLLFDSFRMNLNRQIVGEVRGPEAMAMLKAMQSGAGSISTTHAAHASGAVEKLVTCVMEAGQHATHTFAVRAVSAGIDVVVHVNKQTDLDADGNARVRRYVSEIMVVHPGEEQRGYATTHVFRAGPGESVAVPAVLPEDYRELAALGFDLGSYVQQGSELG